jgi:hypothetical protein
MAYVVLASSGKNFAVPWNSFEFSSTKNKLILDVDKK